MKKIYCGENKYVSWNSQKIDKYVTWIDQKKDKYVTFVL